VDNDAVLPDTPDPQFPAAPEPKPKPCPNPAAAENAVAAGSGITSIPCPSKPKNWYQRFVDGPRDKPLTPKDKAWLAARNIADPFNNITILGEAAISVASDPHSPYGPGMPGYGRYVGVSYSQDFLGEFLGTFLIPSLTHQDPHYHRMPKASIPRRILHATSEVIWTQSDYGKGMLNYSVLAGFFIGDEVSNLYVPGRETNAEATLSRYITGVGTAPIGNYITEFLPDVARHIHVQVVIFQRIINQVAKTEGAGNTP
jgi:hypothetical protein